MVTDEVSTYEVLNAFEKFISFLSLFSGKIILIAHNGLNLTTLACEMFGKY